MVKNEPSSEVMFSFLIQKAKVTHKLPVYLPSLCLLCQYLQYNSIVQQFDGKNMKTIR